LFYVFFQQGDVIILSFINIIYAVLIQKCYVEY